MLLFSKRRIAYARRIFPADITEKAQIEFDKLKFSLWINEL